MQKVYNIPNGPKNLASLFPGVDFTTLEEYYVEVGDFCGVSIATGTINILDRKYHEGKVRVHFLNYLGKIDSINMKMYVNEHEAKSDLMQKGTKTPLNKTDFSLSRINVRSNRTYTLACVDYYEEDMDWICELVDSPFVLIEWVGTQGQDDSYIPIVVLDTKQEVKKFEERYIYEVILQVKLSNEKFVIRG